MSNFEKTKQDLLEIIEKTLIEWANGNVWISGSEYTIRTIITNSYFALLDQIQDPRKTAIEIKQMFQAIDKLYPKCALKFHLNKELTKRQYEINKQL